METLENKVIKYGKALVVDFSILLRATAIYDAANETILNMAKRLCDDIGIFLEETGDFTLKIIEGSFYIEGIRIKAGVSDVEIFIALAAEFKKKKIGLFDFKSPVSEEDLIHLAYSLRKGGEASEVQMFLENKLATGISIGGPIALQKEEGIDLKDSYAVAKRAYLKALSSLKEMNDSIKTGSRVKLKRVKRAVQLMVDCILTDETYLIGFTAARNFENYSYFHPVNVSILSVLTGKRIGLDRHYLRALAIAALFHDIGKIEIPLSILNKKEEFTEKERELVQRHPVEGVKVLLRVLGLSETLMLSMLVSFEHHMNLDHSGYPASLAQKMQNLFSRIVNIADDYDSLLSGKVYSRRRLSKADALELMSRGSGALYDPILLKAFAGIFR